MVNQLANAGTGLEEFGGIARFEPSSGNFVKLFPTNPHLYYLPEITSCLVRSYESLDRGKPFIDALVINRLSYNALCLEIMILIWDLMCSQTSSKERNPKSNFERQLRLFCRTKTQGTLMQDV